MMKKAIGAAFLAAVALSACAMKEEVCCASYPPKAFHAAYEIRAKDKGVLGKQYWDSNGKGKVLISFDGTDTTTLVDYPDRTKTMIRPKEKTYTTSKLELPWISNGTCADTHATPLGDRVIDGHPCKGWQVTDKDGEQSEYWLGDDIGTYVEINSLLQGNNVGGLKLVDYKPEEVPDTKKFMIPADYNEKEKT